MKLTNNNQLIEEMRSSCKPVMLLGQLYVRMLTVDENYYKYGGVRKPNFTAKILNF